MNRAELTNNYYIVSTVSGEILQAVDSLEVAERLLPFMSTVESMKFIENLSDPVPKIKYCELLTREELIERFGEVNE